MTPNEYLSKTLENQNLKEDSTELETLRDRRKAVEDDLREEFEATPTIRYGGSKAKGTLIKEAYDLDVICYFPRDDDDAGGTLEKIYENVRNTLQKKYVVITKTSAIRLQSKNYEDFHIDVVPGRFVDEKKEDAFLHRTTGNKARLKTNLDKHIEHVKASDVVPAIRLAKLWRVRRGLSITHFALELLVIEILSDKEKLELDAQLKHLWMTLRDDVDSVKIEDPANPTGNDLSELLNTTIRNELSTVAKATLASIDSQGWESVFGKLPDEDPKKALFDAATAVHAPSRPWRR